MRTFAGKSLKIKLNMPKKKSGFPYEVHPTPAKGKDGRNIVYAKPARGYKMSMKGVDEFCHKYYNTRDGEITYALEQFPSARSCRSWD